ncbi:MAG: nicotinate-nucleotide adenylyltransferase [Candidatus Thiodiazotropha sp. (ex Lucinoma aequizonata)]|nr:nicotinate-nucleotide adenylyltransferase [Candidatus Thiodiazotropha sp. (ex Lucinoma aequizonata)]MCU7887814.1 nicotinate-nucleotide adenylyltransferase [Candidatus Thiodiazotropha sp. (ex Lucinoma aequizonata)]MCU7893820.1 nicotinate-nucleotide adenylyltransferase [Candidatus Thiodiazotropha sp. (ex Lucinoma aequizonata)]MCU7899359.1 nicotinate-nucleotide adenylyltransferase [Candidatus Thiodiazotropha sp. (ex Lucinoma aequizonata)]MCU7902759.1 nicotinate-nucleotide adenylyltransferase [C
MIGIFSGTFDPIHIGHLRTALDVMQAVEVEEVRFIPLYGAVHRNQPEVSARLRLQMVQAAIQEQEGFVVDDRELQRSGDSYSVDTLASLRRQWPERTLCLLMGMDAFNGFADWRRPNEILGLAHLILMQRPGQENPSDPRVREILKSRQSFSHAQLHKQANGAILMQTVTQLDISATRIRAMLADGQTPRYLLPDAVLQVIEDNQLYRMS